MKRFRLSIILIFVFLLSAPLSAWAIGEVGDGFAAAENRLLALMNEARMNPIQAMIDCGIDPEAVLAARPEDSGALTGGMPPLLSDPRLKTAARAHTLDMLMVNFYGHEGSDGRSYEERIDASGYEAVEVGETLGFIAFYNYMNPMIAAENFFKNMLRDELNPELDRPSNILNPDMRDAGIGLGSGQVVIDERGYNAYMLTCDFGTDVTENITERGAESTLMILINQARMRPLDVAEALGVDTASVEASDPARYARWSAGMSSVRKSDSLTRAAQAHTEDMAMNAYFSHEDLTGKGFQERLPEYGYDANAVVSERLGYRILGDAAVLSDEIQRLFESMMLEEFALAASDQETFLNPVCKDVGIALEIGVLSIEGVLKKVLMMTMDWGGAASPHLFAEGWVYRDRDGDGLYAMGEGVFGVPVDAIGYERQPGEWIPAAIPIGGTITDGAGRFSLAKVSKMLEIWADDIHRVVGNIEKDYGDLVFAVPMEE